ncbi:hypothetical protein JOF56_011628 [Kibdelosporangium banguiense]|uniref:Uncharacterized protein n=1 Tax=Kibdelosporangium banguiense TaxID=1365924 RepID=A0ABS4U3K5_9PSEU|nr:hypothetical protein [Kibdelosporangium banguiense]MBP2331243.1 hypothetical protein [Kibdelosporangium banguiense]
MSIRAFVMLLGVLVALAGVLFLATPVTADATGRLSGTDVAVDCGAVFTPASDGQATIYRTDCSDALTSRGWVGWPLLAVGLVVAIGAAVVRGKKRSGGVGESAVGGGEVGEPLPPHPAG